MTESSADGFDLGLKMRDAAYRVLQVMTLRRQAKAAVWASAALSVAAVGLDMLPPDLIVLKDLLNVGLISGLLKRVAESGEQMSDETIATEMEALLPLARLDELATGQKDLLRALTRQHTWQGQMLRLQEADQEAGAQLLAGFAEMTGDLAEIRTLLAEAATVGQANEIIRLINDEVLPRLSEPAAYHGARSPLPLFTPAPPPPPDILPDPGPLPPGSFLPFDRNERFTGREGDLRELAALLMPITNDELRMTNEERGGGRSAMVVVTTGIGGVGKTMLAVEFAWRYGRFFQGVHWVSAENPDAVDAAVAQCGMRMGLHPAFGGLTLAEQVALTERAWAGSEPWLIIFDNCEDEGLLAARRPKGGGARVLVTSRRERWESATVRVRPLRVMSMPESVLFLRRYLTEGEGRPPRTNLSDSDLRKVAAELGDLPLALRLAGAFLRRYPHVDVTAYLADLRRPDLLEHRSLHAGPQPGRRGVAATFAVSFNRLHPDDPIDAAAVALLARAACFAPGEPLPVELLRAAFADGAEPDDYLINDGLERLLELGLLEPAGEDGRDVPPGGRDVPPERLYRLHRLIARFVTGELSSRDMEEARAAVERAVKQALAQANGSRDPRPLRGAEIHLRHVTDRTAGREDAETAVLNSWLGYYLDMSGDLAGARPYYERALAIRERVLDPEHPDLAASLNNLGALLDSMGDPAGARPYYERAHIIWERVFGPDNPNTAGSLNNMGTLLYSLGDLDGARPYYERALAIRERILGPEHPDTAQSLNNMGELLRDMGDLAEARPYLERALAIRERALGPEHPDTALILNNMGSLLQAMGDLPGARPYFGRALDIRERVLGPEHPDTAQSLNNMGELLEAMGNLAGARSYFERALAIFEAKLGPDHPDARNARDHLAAVA